MKIGKQLNRPSMDRITEILLSLRSTLFNTLSETFMEKAKAKSKKELIRDIMEIDSPLLKGGDFDYASLERTNITNLMLILGMLKG